MGRSRILHPSKYHTKEELGLLGKAINGIHNLRDRVYFKVLRSTGARASEALNIHKNDLDPSTKRVYIHGLKGSFDRSIPLPEALFNDLYELACVSPDGRPFPICYKRMQTIWYEIRPVQKKLHALRHDFALAFYGQTKDIVKLQQLLGHVEIENTMVYVAHYNALHGNDEILKTGALYQ